MKIIRQLGIVCLICLVAEGISMLLPFPCPSAMISMLLLFLLLQLRLLKEKNIHQLADWLLEHMAFFYIPISVGALEYIHVIKQYFVIIFFICLLSFLATIVVTYYVVILVEKVCPGRRKNEL